MWRGGGGGDGGGGEVEWESGNFFVCRLNFKSFSLCLSLPVYLCVSLFVNNGGELTSCEEIKQKQQQTHRLSKMCLEVIYENFEFSSLHTETEKCHWIYLYYSFVCVCFFPDSSAAFPATSVKGQSFSGECHYLCGGCFFLRWPFWQWRKTKRDIVRYCGSNILFIRLRRMMKEGGADGWDRGWGNVLVWKGLTFDIWKWILRILVVKSCWMGW